MPRARHRYPPPESSEQRDARVRRIGDTPETPGPARALWGMAGHGVDAFGGPVVDPTANVLALVAAANHRQDDLREMNNARIDAELRNAETLASVRAKHQELVDALEAKRLDAVRGVDQMASQTEAERNAAAVTALATTARTTAETLRAAVDSAASNLASQLTQTVAAMTERIAALEKSSYEGAGKNAVADPMMEQLVGEMRNLTAQRAADAGKALVADPRLLEMMAEVKANSTLLARGSAKTEGMSDATKWIIALVGLIATLLTIRTGVLSNPAPLPQPQQLIYVPSPPGTMLPSTPPQPVPR